MNNQSYITGTTLIDLNPYKHNQGLSHYLFVIILDRCNGSCKTLDDSLSRIWVPNKTEDVNANAFNCITGTKE